MSTSLKHYLTTIENALKAGNATEHTHRPALKALLEALDLHLTATNEPKRIACGAPDYIISRAGLTIGYIEAKDVGKSLAETERSEQLKRYRRALDNLILTDYLEFRWYVGGELRQEARLAQPQAGGKLKSEKDGLQRVADLLQNFLAHQPQAINTPKDLAERMARLTHIIRDIIVAAFETEEASSLLQGWRDAFARVLLADLNLPEKTPDFADMFAQTLAYGLFTARVMDTTPNTFTRQEAQYLIPKSNPFLRDFFIQITGPQLDDEPFASFVDDLVILLAHTDMAAVLADFGRRTRQEDPVVHFYETFLAAYDPKLREARGVYYTPEPVVSYIVRSVDSLLKTHFNCPQGLADNSTITVPNYDPGLTVKGKKQSRKTTESHKVLILDPATGTGTFLYAVIDHIRKQFMQQGNAGMWPGYVKNHLLPRLFGFELLMAPYAVAHFKLSLQLAGRDLPETLAPQWAYYPGSGERLGVYLTNALEEPHEMTGLPLFTQWVADETNAANEVKRFLPVLVVMGNPPYSNFGMMNKSDWIRDQLKDYKIGLNEKKINLDDDFIKFIRFGQWRIDRSGMGILAFITNNTYLDGITHRRMRQTLMETFTDIYILNLHGSSMKNEQSPDGSKDENVFDIRQGVAIGIFVKQPGKSNPGIVHHAELWGLREQKYKILSESNIETTKWLKLNPVADHFFFVPNDKSNENEHILSLSLPDIFVESVSGIQTGRDEFVSKVSNDDFESWLALLTDQKVQEYELREQVNFPGWKGFNLSKLRQYLNDSTISSSVKTRWLYRPFDVRPLLFDASCIKRTRGYTMAQLQRPNIALISVRQLAGENFRHVFVTKNIGDGNTISLNTREYNYYFPLYLYPTAEATKQKSLLDVSPWPADEANGGRRPNLNPEFVREMEEKLGLVFQPHPPRRALHAQQPSPQEGRGSTAPQEGQKSSPPPTSGEGLGVGVFTPEDIFHYIYAVFHAPTYRSRYAEFLKIDFPRVPLTSDVNQFRSLCALGRELVGLHLLESPQVGQFITRYPIPGDNRVEKGYPKYTPPKESQPGRVYLNKSQYLEGVPPEVWAFYIGGYQVSEKWLKDRQGRQLAYDDLTHYQQVIVALQKTIELMGKIDEAIPRWPVE